MNDEPSQLTSGEDPLRRMMADASDTSYVAFSSLEEAMRDPDGIVILQGDEGGQIYVVCQAAYVRCSELELNQLLKDLDALEWPGNDPSMATVVFERGTLGSGVAGGMGGGFVTRDVWVHPRLESQGLHSEIAAVLRAETVRISHRQL
jgi:hypothetical protein